MVNLKNIENFESELRKFSADALTGSHHSTDLPHLAAYAYFAEIPAPQAIERICNAYAAQKGGRLEGREKEVADCVHNIYKKHDEEGEKNSALFGVVSVSGNQPKPIVFSQTDKKGIKTTIEIPAKAMIYDCPIIKATKENSGESKYCQDLTRLDSFVRQHGFTQVFNVDTEEPTLYKMCSDGEKVIAKKTTPQMAYNEMCNTVKSFWGEDYLAHFKNLYGKKLCSNSGEVYGGNFTYLNTWEDDGNTVYLPYENGVVEITKNNVEFLPHDKSHHLVFEKNPTLTREFCEKATKGEFETFLENASGKQEASPLWQNRFNALKCLIGYLVAKKKEAVNYFCILCDESLDDNNGGTGKSIIMKSISYFRSRYLFNAKAEQKNNTRFRFSGVEPGTHYIQFDDIRQGFDFEELFTMSTDDWVYEKKGCNERVVIPVSQTPKMVFGTNFFPRGDGSSFARRMKLFELSNHYNVTHTPIDEFGHKLFDGWDEEEWKRFDAFVACCVQEYLAAGKLLECAGENVQAKQLAANCSPELIEYFDGLVEKKEICKDDAIAGFFQWYRYTRGQNHANITDNGFGRALTKYCCIKHIKLDKDRRTTNEGEKTFYVFEKPNQNSNDGMPF